MMRTICRLMVVTLAVVGFFVQPTSVSAESGVPLQVHVQEADQYLYTTLMVPVDVATFESGLSLVSISFDGYPVAVVGSSVSAGVWSLEVSSAVELKPGNSVLRLYDGINPSPVFDISLPMHVVPRSPAHLSPPCMAVTAVLSGMSTACWASYEDAPDVVIPEEPGPVDPPQTESSSPKPLPPDLPAAVEGVQPQTVEIPEQVALDPNAAIPQPPQSEKKPDEALSVLSANAAQSQSPEVPAVAEELTPTAAVVSVAAGIAVAGAGALAVNKLGINKPKP